MNSIIMICDDSRIALIKEALQPLLVEKVGIVPDFDTGLKEVFEKRPQVVFIQDEIAGVRGDTVTRHIRSLLQTNSPRFIQLNHLSAVPGVPVGCGNDINLNLPREELLALFRERLEQIPGIGWRQELAEEGESVPVEHPPPAPSAFLPPKPAPSVGATVAAPPRVKPPAAVVDPLFPGEAIPSLPRRRWVVLTGGAIALLCGAVLYLLLPVAPNPRLKNAPAERTMNVSAPLPQASPGMAIAQRLPSFVPREGFDPAYGAAKPGWERYVTPGLEYLVFREKGFLTALQAIALGEEALPPLLVASLLRELSGESSCVILSRSSRDGYLIEQGKGSRGIEVILYRKKGTGATRGVVITFPRTGDGGPVT